MTSRSKVIVVGTSAKGGMEAVIDNHFKNGLYDTRDVELIISNSDGSALKRVYLGLVAAFKLLLAVANTKPIIVHMHGSERGSIYRKAFYLFIAKLFGKKVAFHSHGAEFKHFYDVNSAVYRFLVRYILDRCDAIFVLSKYWQDYMYEIAKPNLVEIINNFPTRAYESFFEKRDVFSKKSLVFLYLGYVGERKGIYDLVDAVDLLLQRGVSNFTIKVAGNGEVEHLKEVLRKRELDSQFNVLGWISGDQKAELMEKSDVLVLPSYNEGLPIAILEAFSTGMPVISTPVGGIPDAITNGINGILVTPGNSIEIADSIQHCLEDRAHIQNILDEANKLYQSEYSAHINIERIDKVYSNLFSR
jgi:glycosyltransferase involved in cell wall biosynthesis